MTEYDIAQVGYGPVGQTLAALLGAQGHRIAVFERWPSLYHLPRAGHVDHEIIRIWQSVGAAEEIVSRSFVLPGYELIGADGEPLAPLYPAKEGISGWHTDYSAYQPYTEAALDRIVRMHENVDVRMGTEVVGLSLGDECVELELADGETVRGRYAIGADGANSIVREARGIAGTDFGFQADFLVVDVLPFDRELDIDMPIAGQICDPARPVSLFRWHGGHNPRFEFMLLPGERREEMETLETCWRLLARWGLSEDNAELLRHIVYRFGSSVADRWRDGRVFLAGDAAHLMPPFLGQGLCSGLRDAKNLAWKLDLVLRDEADPSLLDTYMLERRPHVAAVIEMAVRIGRMICTLDPEEAAARDARVRASGMPPPPAMPDLAAGILGKGGGRLSLQARVRYGGIEGRFDDVVGGGWVLLGIDVPEQDELLERLGAHIVRVDPELDVDGAYMRWLEELGATAVLVRPDFYVFGVARTAEEIPALVDDLGRQLLLTQRAEARARPR